MTTPDPDESGSGPPGPGSGGDRTGSAGAGRRPDPAEPWIPAGEPPAGAQSWVPLAGPPPPAGDPAQLTVFPEPIPYGMLDPTPDPPATPPARAEPATPVHPEPSAPAPQPPPDWSTPDMPAPDWSTPQTRVTTPPFGGPEPEPPVWSGEPGPYPPEPPPPQRDQRIWLILGAVAVLLSCCCVAAGLIAATWGQDIYDLVRDGQQTVGLNQTARDGDLEFQVRRVECGFSRVGDPLINQAAVGQFCVVELAVRNVGKRPAIFADTLQRAFGSGGERFVADSAAGILANADQQVFLSDINPGNVVTGAVVYDVPPDARIVRLELHRSADSRGVVVRTG
jgi:hypothetical protein